MNPVVHTGKTYTEGVQGTSQLWNFGRSEMKAIEMPAD